MSEHPQITITGEFVKSYNMRIRTPEEDGWVKMPSGGYSKSETYNMDFVIIRPKAP